MTQRVYHRGGGFDQDYHVWRCRCGARIRQRRGESDTAWADRRHAHTVLAHGRRPRGTGRTVRVEES